MFCSNCGTEIKGNIKFCPSCGAPTSASEKIKAAAGEVINSAEKELSSAIDEVEASISNTGSKTNAGTNNTAASGVGNAGTDNAATAGSNAGADSSNASGTDSTGADNGGTESGAGTDNTASDNTFSTGNEVSTVSDNSSGYSNNMSNEPKVRLKDDRGIVSYILLNIITCGIYGFYFIHKMAQEVNIACDGDGDETPGLLIFILLSIITCGFYAYYWYYKLGNRLFANASRYNLSFQENGTTVLLWCVVGIVICGIGPIIGMYILIKNSNLICSAYNRQNGLQ